MSDSSISIEISAVLAQRNDWMTVSEVREALQQPASWIRIRLTLDNLVAQERAERRTNPRQYRSLRLGGARVKSSRRHLLGHWHPTIRPA
jgi:hypothetical protein